MADVENQTYPSVDAFMAARREARPEPVQTKTTPEPMIEEIEDEDEIEAADPAAETLDEEPDEANLDSDDEDDFEPEEPAIESPQFWDAEGKEAFAKLSREAQRAVLKYEQQRSKATAQRFNEVAQLQRETQAKQQQLAHHIEKLDSFVSEVESELTEYGKIDWRQEIAEATTQDELRNVQWHQARYAELKQQQEEASRSRQEAQLTELSQFHQVQRTKLKHIAPDLDPDKPDGIQRITQLSRFLEANGIDAETQSWMPAEGMSLAYDAARYRQLMAGKSGNTAAQTPKPPAGPTVRPAPNGSGSSINQRLRQLSNKKTLSQDEFVEKQKLQRRLSKKR